LGESYSATARKRSAGIKRQKIGHRRGEKGNLKPVSNLKSWAKWGGRSVLGDLTSGGETKKKPALV